MTVNILYNFGHDVERLDDGTGSSWLLEIKSAPTRNTTLMLILQLFWRSCNLNINISVDKKKMS